MPAARLRESLEVCALMLSGERFDYAGEHFTLEGAVGRPVPAQPHVPVHIGGAGPTLTMPLVRDFADWWNCPSYGVDRLAELRPLAGDARVSVQRPIGLARDDATRDDTVAMSERRFGAWGGLVGGSAAEVADVLAADVASGAAGFVLPFTDFAPPETIERFMSEVAPHPPLRRRAGRGDLGQVRGKPRSGRPPATGSSQRLVTTLPRV